MRPTPDLTTANCATRAWRSYQCKLGVALERARAAGDHVAVRALAQEAALIKTAQIVRRGAIAAERAAADRAIRGRLRVMDGGRLGVTENPDGSWSLTNRPSR